MNKTQEWSKEQKACTDRDGCEGNIRGEFALPTNDCRRLESTEKRNSSSSGDGLPWHVPTVGGAALDTQQSNRRTLGSRRPH